VVLVGVWFLAVNTLAALCTRGAQVIDSEGDDFATRFYYTGTRDYIPFATINDALSFREAIGGEAAVKSPRRKG